jgi:hypothetical protein
MNLEKLRLFGSLASAAKASDIEQIVATIGPVPPELETLWGLADGFMLNDGIKVYSTSEIIERNRTFEVDEYAPGYLMIADDSGGMAILVPRKIADTAPVFVVGQGVMDPDSARRVSESLTDWIDGGCRTG